MTTLNQTGFISLVIVTHGERDGAPVCAVVRKGGNYLARYYDASSENIALHFSELWSRFILFTRQQAVAHFSFFENWEIVAVDFATVIKTVVAPNTSMAQPLRVYSIQLGRIGNVRLPMPSRHSHQSLLLKQS